MGHQYYSNRMCKSWDMTLPKIPSRTRVSFVTMDKIARKSMCFGLKRVPNAEQNMYGVLLCATNVLDNFSDHFRMLNMCFEMILMIFDAFLVYAEM